MIARHVIARVLETFFRRWWLYILPVVALLGLGAYTAASTADTYRSRAVLSASETLLGEFEDVQGIDTLAFESPAEAVSRRINEALRTDEFVRLVAAGAGVPADSAVITLVDIRQALSAASQGEETLTVRATTIDPVLAQALVQSTIDTYVRSVINNQVSDSTATVEYLVARQVQLEREYEEAARQLATYLDDHPDPFGEAARPAAEEFEILRRNSAVERADDRLSDTLDDIQAAELRIEQATSEATQTLRIVDPPSLPALPEAGLRDAVMTVGTFGVLGMLLLAGSVVAASLLDRSLRFPEEIRASLGVEVLAVVPVEPRRRGGHPRKAAA